MGWTCHHKLVRLDGFIGDDNWGAPLSGSVGDEKVAVDGSGHIFEFHWSAELKFEVGFVLQQSKKMRENSDYFGGMKVQFDYSNHFQLLSVVGMVCLASHY